MTRTRRSELDPIHGSELVEGGRLLLASLLESDVRAHERSGDPVQDLHDELKGVPGEWELYAVDSRG
jgi:hypothetical protein